MKIIHHLEFEGEIQSLFASAIHELRSDGKWSTRSNVFAPHTMAEADVLISKDDKPYAIVEIKSSTKRIVFQDAEYQAHLTARTFNAYFYFVVSPNRFVFFSTEGSKIVDANSLITETDVIELLTRLPDQQFSEEKWRRDIQRIQTLIKSMMEEDEQMREKSGDLLQLLESIKYPDNYSLSTTPPQIRLTPAKEEDLFAALLGEYKKSNVCRFTSLASIFRSIKDCAQSMSSIVGMNDKSETTYVSDFFLARQRGTGVLTSGPEDWNNSYITSCCDIDREKDFTMVRLYADDAKGVIIRYNILDLRQYQGFIMRPVCYQRPDGSHPELEIISRLMAINVGSYSLTLPALSLWQHFFKPREYSFEQEVRLLYRLKTEGVTNDPEPFWILNPDYNILSPLIEFPITSSVNRFPLQLEAITLGPKMREADINRQQLETLLHSGPILNGPNVTITLSDVTHYR